ncbi:MAG TPA: Smr/MutS family protein, partial [Xanthomonadales bacterium]|nr:Smr/MutS family protein [Xanthomonadales bacterium]
LAYVRDGVAPRVLKQLGRGEFAVRDELDLHHMTAEVAASALSDFLVESRRAGRLCVKVIHGKGLRSSEGPVLKRLVDRLLRRRGDVVAYRSARAVDGGSGAVIVLLRRDG